MLATKPMARTLVALGLVLPLLAALPQRGSAEPASQSLDQWFGDALAFGKDISLSGDELRGIGCLAAGSAAGAITLGLGGTVLVLAGLPGVTTGIVAAPVVATTMWAGCAFGSTAAPGLAWVVRNGQSVLSLLGRAVPQEPLASLSGALAATTKQEREKKAVNGS